MPGRWDLDPSRSVMELQEINGKRRTYTSRAARALCRAAAPQPGGSLFSRAVRYFEDINYFKDFENQFPAIVYNDALTSEPKVSSDFENEFLAIVYNDALTFEAEVSSEPTVSAYPAIKIDLDFKISSSDSDDEDYTFIYDKNAFSYKLVSINDLKSDSNNDDDKIDIKQSSEDLSIEPLPNIININTHKGQISF
ncbi:hypothetical protein Tco_0517493 [Tanacetum coccineum]